MNKLQLINSPLKVLITYASTEWHQGYLKEYAEMIKAADVFMDISTQRKQLVVFGHEEEKRISWFFYQYGNGKFNEI